MSVQTNGSNFFMAVLLPSELQRLVAAGDLVERDENDEQPTERFDRRAQMNVRERRTIQRLLFVVERSKLTHAVQKHRIDSIDKLRQLDNQRQNSTCTHTHTTASAFFVHNDNFFFRCSAVTDLKLNLALGHVSVSQFFAKQQQWRIEFLFGL